MKSNREQSLKKRGRLRQSGQFMLESVLLMTMLFGMAMLVKKQFKERHIISKLVAGPWNKVAGMMSNGVWKPEASGHDMHPQGHVMSREGDNQ